MKNTSYFFITTIAIVITLIYGQSLLQPFIFALLLWFIVRKIRHGLNKVKFINKYFPSWLKSLIPSIILITIFAFISKLLMANINSLAKYEMEGIFRGKMVNVNGKEKVLEDSLKTIL